jgi:putative membrane protein
MRVLALLLLLLPSPAFAHTGHLHWWEIGTTWTWSPWVVLPLALSATLYTIGTTRLWRHAGHGRGVRLWQAFCFAGGWLLLFGALVAPLHWLGERLFAAHMIEHEILMAVAAPLIAVSRPAGAMLWGLPARWRSRVGGIGQTSVFAAAWRRLTDPPIATAIHGIALWSWHAPPLYNAALANDFVHWLQHVSFLATALLFWWALLRGRERERGYGSAAFYLFLTSLHSGFLGVLITFARQPIYPLQSEAASDWGLAPLDDQQLAGLIMWIPAGMVYAIAALVLAGVWIAGIGARAGGTDHVKLR